MDQIPQPETPPTLEQVREQFKLWRQSREKRSPIPDALWQAAINLCQAYSISKISSTLRLNHAVLKQRVHAYVKNHPDPCITAPSFIALDVNPSKSASECIVEMEDKGGTRMKMYFKGELGFDLLELGKSFWDKRS